MVHHTTPTDKRECHEICELKYRYSLDVKRKPRKIGSRPTKDFYTYLSTHVFSILETETHLTSFIYPWDFILDDPYQGMFFMGHRRPPGSPFRGTYHRRMTLLLGLRGLKKD